MNPEKQDFKGTIKSLSDKKTSVKKLMNTLQSLGLTIRPTALMYSCQFNHVKLAEMLIHCF